MKIRLSPAYDADRERGLLCSSKEFQREPELARELSQAKSARGYRVYPWLFRVFLGVRIVYVFSTRQVAVVVPSHSGVCVLHSGNQPVIHSFIHSLTSICVSAVARALCQVLSPGSVVGQVLLGCCSPVWLR